MCTGALCVPQCVYRCVVAHVGSKWTFNSAPKIITLQDAGVTCPPVVNKANWLGGTTWPDTFKITQNGLTVSVLRTDSNAHTPLQQWGMDLSFKCCPGTPLRLRRIGVA